MHSLHQCRVPALAFPVLAIFLASCLSQWAPVPAEISIGHDLSDTQSSSISLFLALSLCPLSLSFSLFNASSQLALDVCITFYTSGILLSFVAPTPLTVILAWCHPLSLFLVTTWPHWKCALFSTETSWEYVCAMKGENKQHAERGQWGPSLKVCRWDKRQRGLKDEKN